MSKFWKPGTLGPRSSDQDRSYLNENEWVPTISKGKLPILEKSLKLLYLVEKYQVVVVSSETGSGKTTQIPQFLVDHGWAQGDR
jgi:ATP-dependent RNA helicase DDX35